MRVRWIEPGERTGSRRGEVVVCIAVFGGHEHFVACLDSVLAHTDAEVLVLICDDASPDRRSQQHVAELTQRAGPGHELVYMRQAANLGLVANTNHAMASAAPADVVLLNSDCVVASGWLTGLRAAAYVDATVATATALTNHGSIVSVPDRGVSRPELPPGWNLPEAAAAVRSGSLRLRPRLLTAVGHCVYVRRSALELVGDFDLAFSPGYGEEVDFSLRCSHHGLRHVAADDVLVLHRGGGSFAGDGVPSPVQAEHELMLVTRYPYYHAAVRTDEADLDGPLPRALAAARRALAGLSVVIDPGAAGEGQETGPGRGVNELVKALERLGGVEVTVASSPVSPAPRPADIVHRLTPFADHDDLVQCAARGRRLILTQPDLTGYDNPGWFDDFDSWEGYRRLTRTALGFADHVVFGAGRVRAQALTAELVSPVRASVVAPGIDAPGVSATSAGAAPAGAERLPADGVMLMLAGDRLPDNRLFALRVLEQLQRRHGWPGVLVLAGPRSTTGQTSARAERKLLVDHPQLRDAVIELGAISPPERRWLLGRASLLIDPRVGAGGLAVVGEAVGVGIPCLFAPGTPPGELAPAAAALVAWDAAAGAEQALALMTDDRARQRNLGALRAATAAQTWSATADALRVVYETAARATPRSRGQGEAIAATPHPELTDDGQRLVGPGGALPAAVQRPLLALANRRHMAVPVFGVLRAGYRASYWLKRRAARVGL